MCEKCLAPLFFFSLIPGCLSCARLAVAVAVAEAEAEAHYVCPAPKYRSFGAVQRNPAITLSLPAQQFSCVGAMTKCFRGLAPRQDSRACGHSPLAECWVLELVRVLILVLVLGRPREKQYSLLFALCSSLVGDGSPCRVLQSA